MLAVFVEALLKDGAKIIPEFHVFLGRFVRLLPELGQYSLGQRLADTRHHRVRLQHFAADVERQILAVDDATKEAQIRGQEIGPLVGDEYPPHIELDSALPLRVEKIERFSRWNEEKARVFENSFRFGMQSQPRIIEAVADVVIEFIVLLLGDFRFRTGPQGRGGVYRLFLAGVFEYDRQSDMVGIGIHDPTQSGRFEIFMLTVAQMHYYRGPPCCLGQGFDRKLALTLGNPTPTF